jgi:hypothetical protein
MPPADTASLTTTIRHRLCGIAGAAAALEAQLGPHLPPLVESRLAARAGDMVRELAELADQARLFQPESARRL